MCVRIFINIFSCEAPLFTCLSFTQSITESLTFRSILNYAALNRFFFFKLKDLSYLAYLLVLLCLGAISSWPIEVLHLAIWQAFCVFIGLRLILYIFPFVRFLFVNYLATINSLSLFYYYVELMTKRPLLLDDFSSSWYIIIHKASFSLFAIKVILLP